MRRMVLLREQVREGTLLVVNRQHPLRSSQKIELINVGNGVQMERHAAAAFNECVRLVGGRETIVPVSGWRSAQEQKKIWDDTMRKEGARFTESYVAHPGCSEHQTGLAIDLGKAAGPLILSVRIFRRRECAGLFARSRCAGDLYSDTARISGSKPELRKNPGIFVMWEHPMRRFWRAGICALRSIQIF